VGTPRRRVGELLVAQSCNLVVATTAFTSR
jgi:hypothetical protein